jgi:hypothetical protein
MMTLQQLRKKMFVNRNFSTLECVNFRRIVVHGGHFMAELRETCCGNQTDVSRTYQSNAHPSSSDIGTANEKLAADSVQHELVVQAAPEPFATAGIVLAKIFKSSQSDHPSRY